MHSSRARRSSRTAADRAALLTLALLSVAVAMSWASVWGVALPAGDGPESTAAADVWGIAHAPGYALYTTVAHFFTRLLVGVDLVGAVRILSMVSTMAAIALLYSLIRRLGVGTLCAALAAAGFGLASSTWFYASFPKHNAFTLLVVVSILCTAERAQRGRPGWVVTAGLMLGLSVGVGWFATAATVPAVLFWSLHRSDQRIRRLAVLLASAVAGAAIMFLLVGWRASISPAVNWGDATSFGRVFDLSLLRDFSATTTGPELDNARSATTTAEVIGLPGAMINYLRVVISDLGWMISSATVLGAVSVVRSSQRSVALALGAVAVLNVASLSLLVGVDPSSGDSVLIQGGYLIPTLVVATIGAAAGFQTIWTAVDQRIAPGTGRVILGIAGAGVLLGVSWVPHRAVADRNSVPLASSYGQAILDEVGDDGVLVVWGAENSFAPVGAQTVDGHRGDVTVVFADGLARPWYRQQLTERGLPVDLMQPTPDAYGATCELIRTLLTAGREVWIDPRARTITKSCAASTPVGLTSHVTSTDPTRLVPTDTAVVEARLIRLVTEARLTEPDASRWPNEALYDTYVAAIISASNTAGSEGDADAQLRLLRLVQSIKPGNSAVDQAIAALERSPR